ncbi:MAG: bestrophin family ion channel [Chitinophagales bacterium]
MLLNKPIPAAFIFNKVKYDVLYVFAVMLVVQWLTARYQHLLPEMPLTIPAFIGTSISILLSFKLNQSYDRWWEARKVWGAIVNDSRSFALQLQSLVMPGNEAQIRKIAYRQIAWCYALGRALRGLNPLENLEALLSEEDRIAVSKQQNKPLAILQLHAKDISELRQQQQLDTFSQIQLDQTLVRFCDSQGKAERIKTTVFPVTYRLFLQLVVYLFVVTLSIALRDIPSIFEMPLLLLISLAFFLLEKTATHMQDPFENRPTDTAMTAIARTIEINIRQLFGDTAPKPMEPQGFYLS